MAKDNKTNAMRKLDSMKIDYREHYYTDSDAVNGIEVAQVLKQNPEQVFKTLVTVGKSGNHYVYMIPVAEELDLKKAAAAVGEKSVAMVKSKELLELTGYIHGGCSPIGMKKQFKTFIHETAPSYEKIYVSAGRVGAQIELSPADLISVTRSVTADIIVNV